MGPRVLAWHVVTSRRNGCASHSWRHTQGASPRGVETRCQSGPRSSERRTAANAGVVRTHEPYAEAVREGNSKVELNPLPRVNNGAEALGFAEIEAVVMVELDGTLATEVYYRVPWDEEHTLGARFCGPHWVELCGSTLVP